MKYYDVVWEKVDINDKDILKIINHKSMQRIKNIWISAYGYLFDLKRNSTRFDHSVGVYLLLKHFKATKEEQIAGLVHDIAHTALSHVSTYAFQGKFTGVEFHELQHQKFIKESGLADLITSLGYNVDTLLHNERHTLLENQLPDICADRLDYTLRDALHLQILSRQQVKQILNGLKIYKGEFVFTKVKSAFNYSFAFFLLNLMHYGSATEALFNNDFGSLVKYAVRNRVLVQTDWYTDDITLINKLKKSKKPKIQSWLSKYNNKMVVFEDNENPDWIYPKKIRIVNPKVLIAGKIKRLSQVSSVYKKLLKDYTRTHKTHELPVKLVYKA